MTNSPKQWEAEHGVKLRFIPGSNGKNPVLVLDKAVLSGKRQIARRNKSRSAARVKREQSIVMFVLIPGVDFANAFAIEPVIDRRRQSLPRTLEAKVRQSLGK